MMCRVAGLLIASGLLTVGLFAQQPTASAVYTEQQAAAGRKAYQASCASCHTPDLGGRQEFPQLAGDDFMSSWRTRTTKDLYEFIHMTMPPEGPQLSSEQTLDIVAFMLEQNGAAAGTTALTPTTEVAIGKVATGKRPALVVSSGHADPAPRP